MNSQVNLILMVYVTCWREWLCAGCCTAEVLHRERPCLTATCLQHIVGNCRWWCRRPTYKYVGSDRYPDNRSCFPDQVQRPVLSTVPARSIPSLVASCNIHRAWPNSVEQSPWDADRSTASKEIPCILITIFTSARHLSLSYGRWIHSTPFHYVPWSFILILFSMLQAFQVVCPPLPPAPVCTASSMSFVNAVCLYTFSCSFQIWCCGGVKK